MRIAGLIAALALVTALVVGCSTAAPRVPASSVEPALGLHSAETSFTVRGVEYRLSSVRFARHPGFPQLELLTTTLRAHNSLDTTIAVDPVSDLESALFSRGGDERVSSEGPQFELGPMDIDHNALGPGGDVSVTQTFEVRRGETGLVLRWRLQPGADLRWFIR